MSYCTVLWDKCVSAILLCLILTWAQWFTVLFCKISLSLYCSVRSVCHCTVLWDQSVTVLFCEISLSLYCSVRSVCHCTVLWDQSVTVLFCEISLSLYCSVRSVCHCTVLWDQSVTVLFCKISLSLYCSVRSVCHCTVLWDSSVTVLFCEISLLLYCSVRSVCHCTVFVRSVCHCTVVFGLGMRSLIWEWGQYFTVLCDQSVTTIVFDLNMRSLLYCTVLWDQSVIVLFDLDMRSVLYCTVLWDQSVTVLLCLVLPWGQRLTVLFWAHLQDLVYNPPSLLELSGRVVKVEKMRYSREDLPLNLVRYLDSAQRCVNPHCKGRSPTCPMQRFLSCLMWHCVSIRI